MSATKAMATVAEAVTLLDIVTGFTTPIARLAIVLPPCMNGTIANGDPSLASSLPSEIRGRVVVAVNATTNASIAQQ